MNFIILKRFHRVDKNQDVSSDTLQLDFQFLLFQNSQILSIEHYNMNLYISIFWQGFLVRSSTQKSAVLNEFAQL